MGCEKPLGNNNDSGYCPEHREKHFGAEKRERQRNTQAEFRGRQAKKLAEAERVAAELLAAEAELAKLSDAYQKQQAVVEALKARKVGRPPTLTKNAKYLPRLRELKAQNKTLSQITMIMNRETGDNRTSSGWRHILEDSPDLEP